MFLMAEADARVRQLEHLLGRRETTCVATIPGPLAARNIVQTRTCEFANRIALPRSLDLLRPFPLSAWAPFTDPGTSHPREGSFLSAPPCGLTGVGRTLRMSVPGKRIRALGWLKPSRLAWRTSARAHPAHTLRLHRVPFYVDRIELDVSQCVNQRRDLRHCPKSDAVLPWAIPAEGEQDVRANWVIK